MNVSDYLLSRLYSCGVKHVFGVPGDFVLPLFEAMVASDITHVATCNELNAGYAADGYARVQGMGAAVVTYGPGSFSALNAVAGAFAESVPLVLVSGGPDSRAYGTTPKPVLHHMLPGNYNASLKIFEQVTAHACLIDDVAAAAGQIDRALEICLATGKPVYLEIAKDIQLQETDPPVGSISAEIPSDTGNTEQALALVVERIRNSTRTVILPGHEIQRRKLQDDVVALLQKTAIPAASMFVGKAEYLEHLPCCIGAYQGAASEEAVQRYVEEADTVVYLGAVPSDLNLGGFTARLTDTQTITAWDNQVVMKEGSFTGVSIVDLVAGLTERLPANVMQDSNAPTQCFTHRPGQYQPAAETPLSNRRFYDRLANFFRPGDIVLADAGSAFSLTHTQFPEDTSMIASNYWASIGMGFAAALGACFAADTGQRVIAVEGDGSFQMTAQELSSLIRYGMPAIVFIINNNGFTAERLIHDGPFNDIPGWRYHRLPEAFGGGTGIEVRSEGELESALEQAADSNRKELLLIEVHLDPYDVPEGFRKMCNAFRSH